MNVYEARARAISCRYRYYQIILDNAPYNDDIRHCIDNLSYFSYKCEDCARYPEVDVFESFAQLFEKERGRMDDLLQKSRSMLMNPSSAETPPAENSYLPGLK